MAHPIQRGLRRVRHESRQGFPNDGERHQGKGRRQLAATLRETPLPRAPERNLHRGTPGRKFVGVVTRVPEAERGGDLIRPPRVVTLRHHLHADAGHSGLAESPDRRGRPALRAAEHILQQFRADDGDPVGADDQPRLQALACHRIDGAPQQSAGREAHGEPFKTGRAGFGTERQLADFDACGGNVSEPEAEPGDGVHRVEPAHDPLGQPRSPAGRKAGDCGDHHQHRQHARDRSPPVMPRWRIAHHLTETPSCSRIAS